MKNTMLKKVINILLDILIGIFGLVFLVSLYTGIQVKILGHKYPNFFGYSMFEVTSNSMADVITAGDWIIVKLTDNIKLDDIITYELDGNNITHRVVGVYDGTYVTRGDANSAKDEPVDQSQIIGKMTKSFSNFGLIRKTLFNPAVLITFIITLFLFNAVLKKPNEKMNFKLFAKFKQKKVSIVNEDETLLKMEEANLPLNETDDLLASAVNNELADEENAAPSMVITNEEESSFALAAEPVLISADELARGAEDTILDVEEPLDFEKDDELDQTRMFRVISVDLNELDETQLEIAKHEMAEKPEPTIEPDQAANKPEEIAPQDENVENVGVNLSARGSSKNIIDALMNIKKEEIYKIIDVLMNDGKPQTNEATIKTAFVSTYINAKYYNYYDDKDGVNGRNLLAKVEKVLKITAADLIDYYHGSDTKYNNKVYLYANIFRIIANLDQAKEAITENKAKKEFYKKTIMSYYLDYNHLNIEANINAIFKIQKTYMEIEKFFLQRLETKNFSLETSKLPSKKHYYAVDLAHDIAFNKVYSEYIIEKTYSEGVIAEDKIKVLLTLLSSQILKDMIKGDFNRKYVFYLPSSLYQKEKKVWRLLKMIDDEYAKNHTLILIDFKDLKQYKYIIKKIKKAGFRFALNFADNKGLLPVDKTRLYMVDAMFVNRKGEGFEEIISYIPDELLEKVIYDDIINKISIGVSNE